MIAEHHDVDRLPRALLGQRQGQRQAGLAVWQEGPGQAGKAPSQLGFGIDADRERDGPDRMGVDHDRVRQQGMQRGFDRGPQAGRIELGHDRAGDRISGAGLDAGQHRPQADRHEARPLVGLGQPQARGFDPEEARLFERGVAAGRLDLLGIAAEAGRERRQLGERGGWRHVGPAGHGAIASRAAPWAASVLLGGSIGTPSRAARILVQASLAAPPPTLRSERKAGAPRACRRA